MAIEATKDEPEGGFDRREILGLLEVRGSRNAHLADPIEGRGGFQNRNTPLEGSEPVYGNYLTLRYLGHDPAVVLTDHDDLPSLEAEICSGSGYLNPFSTLMVAIVEGRVRPFRILHGAPGQAREIFRKRDQSGPAFSFGTKYLDPGLEWDPA